MLKSKKAHDRPALALGPMSTEIIESVFYYSNYFRKPLMLIASKNQIDHAGGYVNNWTTVEYMKFVEKMRQTYPVADVKICRDHCGPGFNGNYDIKDVFRTIKTDIQTGFDLIHIDFCKHKGTAEEKLVEAKKAVQYALKLKPDIEIEIGTDENQGTNYSLPNIREWEEEIDYFKKICKPTFYVVQTGSLVMEINQVGNFNKSFVEKVSKLIRSKNLKLKEHNGDYLSKEEIADRIGVVDAINIAPQLGVVQTTTVINKCLIYGIRFDEFANEVYKGGKWKKWMLNNTPENKMLCVLIAGHYHFNSESYKKIIKKLEEKEDIKSSIMNAIISIIRHYVEG